MKLAIATLALVLCASCATGISAWPPNTYSTVPPRPYVEVGGVVEATGWSYAGVGAAKERALAKLLARVAELGGNGLIRVRDTGGGCASIVVGIPCHGSVAAVPVRFE
jgi:hypothetical protein